MVSMVSRIPARITSGFQKIADLSKHPGRISDPKIIAGNIAIMIPHQPGYLSNILVDGRIPRAYVVPVATFFREAHNLADLTVNDIALKLVAEGIIDESAGLPEVSLPEFRREILTSWVALELAKQTRFGVRYEAINTAIEVVSDLKSSEAERQQAVINAVVQGLDYSEIRDYEVNMADETWLHLKAHGKPFPSRFGKPSQPDPGEVKAVLNRLLAGGIDDQWVKEADQRGLLTWKRNGRYAILHVLKRSHFEPERVLEDRKHYVGDCEEMLFLVLGDIKKHEKIRAYQISNWENDLPLLADEERFIRILARALAIADINAESQQKLKDQATIDDLTQIPNRRGFRERMELEFSRSRRSRKDPLSLVMIDIDFFKKVNDNYGHDAGDAVLVRVGQVLQRVFKRSGDFISRYGGEEFAVILPLTNGSGESAVSLSEEFRRAIEAEEIRVKVAGKEIAIKVTVSMGVTTYHPEDENFSSPGELIYDSDNRLYDAKAGGRNRIAVSQK
jgi:diguanylate cyclase (GGDEF)-like protein